MRREPWPAGSPRQAPAGSRRQAPAGGPRAARERGQASVELLAVLPLGLAVVLALAVALSAHDARTVAGQAAHAAAVAATEGQDALEAGRAAVGAEDRRRLRLLHRGRRIEARVRARGWPAGAVRGLDARRVAIVPEHVR